MSEFIDCLDWVTAHRNRLFACAGLPTVPVSARIIDVAARRGLSVFASHAACLERELSRARRRGRAHHALVKIFDVDLLIVDGWRVEHLEDPRSRELLKILRSRKKSTAVVSESSWLEWDLAERRCSQAAEGLRIFLSKADVGRFGPFASPVRS